MLCKLPESLTQPEQASTILLACDGTPISHWPRQDHYRHLPVELSQIPKALQEATLAAEDKRFYLHHGLDLLALFRSTKDNIEAGRVVSGASTITQQLIKLSLNTPPRRFHHKIHEAFLARNLEMRWSKEEILQTYFNRLDYGSKSLGPAAAARFYFQKPLSQLSLAECALLAGIPQAPTRNHPLRNPIKAKARRDWVLDRMHQVFNYPREEIIRAKAEPIQLRPFKEKSLAPHLSSLLRNQDSRGIIKTTIDASLQKFCERTVTEELKLLQLRNAQHAAVLVMDHHSGEILAMVGSADFQSQFSGQLNGIFTPRSAGSTLKPFTYLLAFERGLSWPGHVLADIPSQFQSENGSQTPHNYDYRHYGPVSVRFALANSLNIAAMRQLMAIGGPRPLHAFLTKLGMQLPRPPSFYGLGLTIGNAEISLFELTRAYAIIARGGRSLTPKLVLEDKVNSQNSTSLFQAESAHAIRDILSDPIARAHAFGRHSSLNFPFPCAVKTGTSSDFHDNWCIGFTDRYVVGVWVGNFEHTPMQGISGLSGAGPIFHRVVSRLGGNAFPNVPEARIWIDRRTGHQVFDIQTVPSQFLVQELKLNNSPPIPLSAEDYDQHGRAYLSSEFAEWWKQAEPHQKEHFVLKDELPSHLKIVSPRHHGRYLLDPDMPGGTQRLTLKANYHGDIHWYCDSLEICKDSHSLILKPGKHRLRALIPNSPLTCEIDFEVTHL